MAKKKAPAASTEAKPPKGDSAKFWHSELTASEKRERTWRKRAKAVVDRYRDEREKDNSGERRTNILWSNTEILKAVLFQNVGNPDVRRRFPKKGKDEKTTRSTALVIERALAFCTDDYDVKSQIEAVVEDHLLAGRGTAWICYDAEVVEEAPEPDDENEDEDGPQPIDIGYQSVQVEHVYWEDYRTSAGRKENDIWWKARRHQYTKSENEVYFPEHAQFIPLDAEMPGCDSKDPSIQENFKRANIWEIWDKSKKQRIYVAEGYPTILKKDEDPYKLKQFYPCPPALYGVKTTSSLTPIPEYTLYQDQCEELDRITTRLNRLIEALKRRGVYDATMEGPDNQLSALQTAEDNEFVPYKGFAALMEKGGLKGVFASEDLTPIMAAVQGLYEQRQNLIQTIYEVTGISDVIRGSSNPNDTATAQRIKGQFGSLRITNRQAKVQEFVRSCYRLKAEIIAEHYTRENLQEMTGVDLPLQAEIDQAKMQLQMQAQAQQQAQAQAQQPQAPQGGQTPPGAPQQMAQPPLPQMPPEMVAELQRIVKAPAWEDVEAILRSDKRRGYKVDIETDDTAQFDEQAEKESRVEFLNTMQPTMQNALMMTQQAPELLPLAKETMLFTVRAFKAGRSLEEAFEDAFDTLANRPPTPPQPDPEQIKAQIAAKQADAQLQIQQQQAQSDLAIANANIEGKKLELQGKQMDLQAKAYQMDLDFMSGKMDLHQQATDMQRSAEAHELNMQGAQAKQQQGAEAHAQSQAAAEAKAQQNTVKTPSNPQNGAPSTVPSRAPAQPPTSQLQQVLTQMVLGLDELRKSNEILVKAVTAPKTTRLIKDQSGRSVAAVQQTMGFDQPAPMGNA
jgi:hypothetical protein